MTHRLFQSAIVVFWLLAMCWLVTSKMIHGPADLTDGGKDGRYLDLSLQHEQVKWSISLDHLHVGHVVQSSHRTPPGEVLIESIVRFDRLPVQEIAQGLLGPLASLLQSTWSSQALSLPVIVTTELQLSRDGLIRTATARVDVRDETGIMRLHGVTVADRFRYAVEVPQLSTNANSGWQTVYQGEYDATDVVLLSDSVLPYARLNGLQAGQTWTLRSVRPLAMLGGTGKVRARVVGRSEILWAGQLHAAYRVEFEDENLEASQPLEPLTRLWVLEDGRIVRQRVRFGRSFAVLERLHDP